MTAMLTNEKALHPPLPQRSALKNGMEGFSVHAGSKPLLSRKGNGQLVIPLYAFFTCS